MIAPASSLLHTPVDLDFETEINAEIKNWLAFAKQKLGEISDLHDIAKGDLSALEISILRDPSTPKTKNRIRLPYFPTTWPR